jgi:hypothetical protein
VLSPNDASASATRWLTPAATGDTGGIVVVMGGFSGVASLPNCPGIVLAIYKVRLDIASDLDKYWCAILGLNQSVLAPC